MPEYLAKYKRVPLKGEYPNGVVETKDVYFDEKLTQELTNEISKAKQALQNIETKLKNICYRRCDNGDIDLILNNDDLYYTGKEEDYQDFLRSLFNLHVAQSNLTIEMQKWRR